MLFTKRDLYKLIIPLIIEQILAVTIGMADTMMISSVGETAVSGISLVDNINNLCIQVFSALATGGAVVSAQYFGKRDMASACAAAKQLLYSITALSMLIMAMALAGQRGLLRLIFGSIEEEVMGHAQTYLLLSALSYPFLGIYNSGAALFRSMGNSKVSMYSSLLMNGLNIGGNALTIFVFHWGVFGAGLSTLISRMAGAVIMLVLLRHKNNPIHIEKLLKFELRFGMVKNILRIGVPNGMENGMFQIGKLLVQSLVATFGTAAIAANAVAGNMTGLSTIPGAAIGLAMITIVGQCVGAKDYDQARKYIRKLMVITYISVGVLNLAMFFLSRPLARLYSLTPGTEEMATNLIRIYNIACIVIWPASFTLPNAFRAANDVKFTMLVSVISMWTSRIGSSYLFALTFGLGIYGVWLGMFADWVVRAALFLWRLYSGRWKQRQYL